MTEVDIAVTDLAMFGEDYGRTLGLWARKTIECLEINGLLQKLLR